MCLKGGKAMCGIGGIMTLDGRPVIDGQQRVQKLVKAQQMRGPDQEGIFISENIALGQPMIAWTPATLA